MMPTVAEIRAAVARETGVSERLILSNRRAGEIVRARQLAMYIARELTALSFPELGRLFSRDHTTVMHGARAVEARLELHAEAHRIMVARGWRQDWRQLPLYTRRGVLGLGGHG